MPVDRLRTHLASSPTGMDVRSAVEAVGLVIDVAGVAIIVLAIVVSLGRFAVRLLVAGWSDETYRSLRRWMGRGILLGLELLVAGDIIRTVAIEPTFANVAVLGIIVLIRTFLSFSLEVEMSGQWPWQRRERVGA